VSEEEYALLETAAQTKDALCRDLLRLR